MERTMASGRSGSWSASHADSMSTARAPVAARSARWPARTRWGDDTMGPVRTSMPFWRRSWAIRSAPGRERTMLPSTERTSVATTSCPTRRSGSRPPATPTRATAREEGSAASPAPAAVALAWPMPVRVTSPPTARASMRNGDTTVSSATGLLRDPTTEGHHREHQAIQVIVDVEVSGEPGTGEPRLVPRPVLLLGAAQEVDTPLCGRAPAAGGEEGQQGPGRLGGGGGALPGQARVLVGAEVLAPSAVGVLVVLKPADRPGHRRVVGAQAGRS